MKRKGKLLKMTAMLLITLLVSAVTVHAQEEQEKPNQLTLKLEIEGQPALVEDGTAEAELSDGTTVTVEGDKLPDGLLLMVKVIGADDRDVLAWIEKCMKGKGTKLRAYDIYFVDGNGRRYELTESINIAISLNGDYARPAVYYIALDGRTELMKGTAKDGRISFVTSYDSYYALVEQEEDSTEEETTPTPTPEEETNPSPTPGEETEPSTTPGEETEPSQTPGEETEPSQTPGEETEPSQTPEEETEPSQTPEEETKPSQMPGTNENNSGTATGTGGASGTGTTQGTGAKTGDETNLAGLLVMLLLSGIAVLGLTAKSVYQKRR